ncbi:MAG: PGF-CTERM sorting domain-containing protein, partial [Methanocorpusculum sp.]|nr:PGF-CTERM sorting domain-containing protein [Methanocorpusculum sp.]
DALDTQNIDDMYVKHSFIVVGEDAAFTINEIPAEVAQGETFTVSGTSTAAAGKYVVVEMLSTAFAAVPKETVGSAAFIVLTTKVAEDGTWEVTFDTSDLNVDEYSIKVACDNEEWKNTKINVVEAGDEPVTPEQPEEPEQPEQPEQPEAPATPGFGALAALAGLGAVAVLLLRRE